MTRVLDMKTRVPEEEDLTLAIRDDDNEEDDLGRTNYSVTWYGHAGYSEAIFYVNTKEEGIRLIEALSTIVMTEYD